MTCRGCDRSVTLIDGYYCGHCSSTIASAVRESLEDLDSLIENPVIHDTFVDEDGLLNIRIETGEDSHRDRVEGLVEEHREALDALEDD